MITRRALLASLPLLAQDKTDKATIDRWMKELSNWGRWGKDDHIGTLNHVTPEDIAAAAKLVKTGKVFALGIPLDRTGPQTGLFGGRFNPIHQMLATGTDAIAGQQDWNKIRYADDTLMLCVQGATHWDALGHIFYEEKTYNGHDAKLIDSRGLSVLGIEHSKNKMVGRGVLLDVQHNFAAGSHGKRGAVIDGRDIGTVVFPDAEVKLFLDADLETRAERRHAELRSRGVDRPMDAVREDLRVRDDRDRTRPDSPLRAAPGAVILDTSGMDIERQVEAALAVVRAHPACPSGPARPMV